jgi:hypothetical protein
MADMPAWIRDLPDRPARSPAGRANLRAEARPGRECALILTSAQTGEVTEMVLDARTCRELSAVLTRAAR